MGVDSLKRGVSEGVCVCKYLSFPPSLCVSIEVVNLFSDKGIANIAAAQCHNYLISSGVLADVYTLLAIHNANTHL